jgi:hypothetical protein
LNFGAREVAEAVSEGEMTVRLDRDIAHLPADRAFPCREPGLDAFLIARGVTARASGGSRSNDTNSRPSCAKARSAFLA